MMCSGWPGTGTPQSNVVLLTDRSFKPPDTKLMTSFRFDSGAIKSGLAS